MMMVMTRMIIMIMVMMVIVIMVDMTMDRQQEGSLQGQQTNSRTAKDNHRLLFSCFVFFFSV